MLVQFGARNINLSKLESRPTKKALGDYCFIIDFAGHVADAVVGDCLRDLHAELAGVKFLGSYPAAGSSGPAIRRDAEASTREGSAWVEELRGEIRPNGSAGLRRRNGAADYPGSRWGGMAERTNARLLKSREVQASVG